MNLDTGPMHPRLLIIKSHDGRRDLLRIDLVAGTVEGELEDTSEAAAMFVRYVRDLLGATR